VLFHVLLEKTCEGWAPLSGYVPTIPIASVHFVPEPLKIKRLPLKYGKTVIELKYLHNWQSEN